MIVIGDVTVHHGNCLNVLATMGDCTVDSVVTDPPYELGFMGKDWDNSGIAYRVDLWREVLRVLKPGGHLLAFGGTRTYHRMAVAIEDAGFEIRDSIHWVYGSGFPKSLDVSKAIDKRDASDERLARAREFQSWLRQHLTPQQINEATGTDMGYHLTTHPTQPFVAVASMFNTLRPLLPDVPQRIEELVAMRTVESNNFKAREVTGSARMVDTTKARMGFAGETFSGDGAGATRDVDITRAHTDAAKQWEGWGTALKPAHEPIVVARRPLIGTVAANVLEHGTGALNIDGARIPMGDEYDPTKVQRQQHAEGAIQFGAAGLIGREIPTYKPGGRWPANVIFDPDAAAELDGQEPGASRFFYIAKPSKAERNAGLEGLPERIGAGKGNGLARRCATCDASVIGGCECPDRTYVNPASTNPHPTVKPLQLMRYLIRLVTPPGGTVLEPFAGSGTTLMAATIEGFTSIGIEMTDDYLPIIEGRVRWAQRQQQALW